MKYFSRLIWCCLLVISNSSFADVKIRLTFDGAPYVAKKKPNFTCLEDSKQRWFDCELTPTQNPGEYVRKDLAAGSYSVLFDVDENQSNLNTMPGDFRADFRFNITSSKDDQIVDIPMTKLIHLVKPQSNNSPIDGTLIQGCNNKPLYIPAGHPWTKDVAIPFEWEPIANDVTYKVTVERWNCKSFGPLGQFLQFETKDTSISLELPPNAEDEQYAFFIYGFRGGNNVGTFITYDAGSQGWNYGFKVAPVTTPHSYYLTALVIVLVLVASWFAMSYGGAGILLRSLVLTMLIAMLILGKVFIPNSETYIPYKYFDVPPVLLANKKPPEAKVSQVQTKNLFSYIWAQEVPKPDWWNSITPTRNIATYSDLMLWWQSHDSSENSEKELFKAIYQAIDQHPNDEQLVVTGMAFLFYLSNDQKILSQVGRVAIQHHLHHVQRIDNCANCSAADTISGIAARYAYSLSQTQEHEKGISMLEDILKVREKDMSNYVAAETYAALVDLLYQTKRLEEARVKLNYALDAFATTNRIDQLKYLDNLVKKQSEISRSTVALPALIPQTPPIQAASSDLKPITRASKNRMPTDLRYCLELISNYEIAKCANQF